MYSFVFLVLFEIYVYIYNNVFIIHCYLNCIGYYFYTVCSYEYFSIVYYHFYIYLLFAIDQPRQVKHTLLRAYRLARQSKSHRDLFGLATT